MDVAYENDPHSRIVMICAVTGGVLALGPLALFLVMPSVEIPAGGFPGGEGFAAAKNDRSVAGGVMLAIQLLLFLILFLAVRRRRLATPDAPATRILVVMTSVLGALTALHLLILALQVFRPRYLVAEMVTTSMSAGASALLLTSLVLGGDRLHRLRATDPGRQQRRDRNSQLLLAFFCALPPLVIVIKLVHSSAQAGDELLPAALLSLPTTAIALWAIHQMQGNRRMPFRILLAGFGWGAVVAPGLGLELPLLYTSLSDQLLGYNKFVMIIDGLRAPVFEELAKGVGILLIAVVARRWVTDLLSGLVVGASVGLGFNYIESMLYMAAPAMGGTMFQHWLRQVVGIMLMHVAFSALVGAGIGAARQIRNPRARLAVIAYGLLTAICAHYLYNALGSFLARMFRVNDTVFAMIVMPSLVLLLLGLFLVMYLVLRSRGLRYQNAALAVELRHEAGTDHDAVTIPELPVLLNPARRFRTRVDTLRRDGPRAYRNLTSLYQAQLDLGLCRWHQARQDPDQAEVDLAQLRRRVRRLKFRLEMHTGQVADE